MMKSFLSIALLLFISATACAEDLLTAAQVLAKVKANGAPAVVAEIWQSESKTQAFLTGVGSGSEAWLEAAKAIQPATDAGASEELGEALAEALVNSPYAVLPWLKQLWWGHTQPACLFGYDSELPGGVAEYIARLEAALAKQSPANLRALHKQCLLGIKQTRKALAGAPH